MYIDSADRECEEMLHGKKKTTHPDTVHTTIGIPVEVISKEENTTPPRTEKAAQKATEKPMDTNWEPTKGNTWLDNLKGCAKWALLFGGLSFLIFYWKEAGLMAESISVPCMCVCTALAGWGVGKNATRGRQ